jgi:AraC-like DNA-binding protein
LPDGCLELVVNLGDPIEHESLGGARTRASIPLIVGLLERAVRVAYTGEVELLGVRFRPAGATSLLREDMRRLVGRIVPLDGLAGGLARELARSLSPEQRIEDRLRRIQAILLQHMPSCAPPDPIVTRAVNRIDETRGAVSVSTLMRELDIGARQLTRRFTLHVGHGPKRLARIRRFRGVCERALDLEQPDWAAVAAEAGYHDQAHMIRDFRAFTGLPPDRFLRGLTRSSGADAE